MRLLIKQRVFSWSDTYDVYDQNEESKYFVKAEFFSLGHKIHIYDRFSNEIGVIREKVMSLLPVFEIEIQGKIIGKIQKKFTLFNPKYEVDFNGWRVEGNFVGWNYDVLSGCSVIMHIAKEPLHWGDTYIIDFQNQENEIMGLLLVLAIDAANSAERR